MAGLSSILTNYRTKLAALSGFKEQVDSLEVGDAPYTIGNRLFAFKVKSLDHKDRGKLEGVFGGSHLDIVPVVELEIRYLTQIDSEKLHLTIASDFETVTQALLSASNRYSDATTVQLIPMEPQSPMVVSKVSDTEWKVVGLFTTTYRLTLGLS